MTSTKPRVLIVVGSRHGSTLGIAGALAQRLVADGFQATIAEPDDCGTIDADLVVVGSAVYLGKWLKSAARFVDDHAEQLAELPVWLFSSGPLAEGEAGDGTDEDEITRLIERTGARGHRTFAGRLDRALLGPVETLIARVVRAPTGDFRNWPEINEWADEIAAAMGGIDDADVRRRAADRSG